MNCLRSSAVVPSTYLVLPIEIQPPPHTLPPATASPSTLWLYKLRGQGGSNSLSLVSEGCCTLFALCRNVSPPCEPCIFSFCLFAFMSQVHYFVIITSRKSSSVPALSLSPIQECENWILHLKVNFHNGITHSASPRFTLLLPFMSHLSSSTLMHLFICCGLLYSFEAVLFLAQPPESCFSHFCIAVLPLASVFACVRAHVLVCLHTQIFSSRLLLTEKRRLPSEKKNPYSPCSVVQSVNAI